eukprot:3125951-Rhodomonas_salina.2
MPVKADTGLQDQNKQMQGEGRTEREQGVANLRHSRLPWCRKFSVRSSLTQTQISDPSDRIFEYAHTKSRYRFVAHTTSHMPAVPQSQCSTNFGAKHAIRSSAIVTYFCVPVSHGSSSSTSSSTVTFVTGHDSRYGLSEWPITSTKISVAV